jgi:hypothetical protein
VKKITLIGLLISLNVFSQEVDVSVLEKLKQNLTSEINALKDSLQKVEFQIALLKSKKIKEMAYDSSLTSYANRGATIKNSPKLTGEIIIKLAEKKQVILLDYYDGYFGICTDSICGYMSELWIQKNKNVIDFLKVKNEEQEKLKNIENEKKIKIKEAEYAELEKKYIKKYGQKTYNKLKQGYYWVGMNKEMATISLGSPNYINRSVGSWGVNEQWVYNGIYLYFKNGKLTSYQN